MHLNANDVTASYCRRHSTLYIRTQHLDKSSNSLRETIQRINWKKP